MICRALPAALGLALAFFLLVGQASGSQEPPAGPLVQAVHIDGASVYTVEDLTAAHQIAPGTRLTRDVGEIAADIRKQYHADGYTLAEVNASLDAGSGTLTIRIAEGRFDAVDVSGVTGDARSWLLENLALYPGELFNASQAERALDAALSATQGAIERVAPTFTLVSDGGRNVLRIALRTRSQQSGPFVGTQGREDWYSPVDALNFGLGLHGTIFDQTRFNHTYWAGHVTYKSGPDRAGYALGFERPFFAGGVLQAGAAIHDLTASDDQWRLGGVEQSLVALMFRNTFRDYYRRKGYQLHAAVRPLNDHELLVAWRDEEHLALANETNYGFFRDDHVFRANAPAQEGDLRSLLIAYTYDTRGLGRPRAAERYRRHLLDDLFGEQVDRDQGVRLDWRSELAPASFADDFDFSRHITNARAWWQPSPGRLLSARLLAGASSGALPPQRVFALGGIGTVRGYRFKEASGDAMLVLNGEFRQQLGHSNVAGLVFLDAGRVYEPHPGSSGEWMRGVGIGLELGGARLELGWRLDDIPRSLQVLFRLKPTF